MTGVVEIRKRPAHTLAIRYTGGNTAEVIEFAGDKVELDDDGLVVHTDRGDTIADPGDWIVRGLVGEVYPCTPEAFDAGWEILP